jgi:hypothetical protein
MNIWAKTKRLASNLPPEYSLHEDRDRLVRSKLGQQRSRTEWCLIREAKYRQHLNGVDADISWTVDHHSNYKELKRYAAKGCNLCLLLNRELPTVHGDRGAFLNVGKHSVGNNWFDFRLKLDIWPNQVSCNLMQHATRRGAVWLQFVLTSEESEFIPPNECHIDSDMN